MPGARRVSALTIARRHRSPGRDAIEGKKGSEGVRSGGKGEREWGSRGVEETGEGKGKGRGAEEQKVHLLFHSPTPPLPFSFLPLRSFPALRFAYSV